MKKIVWLLALSSMIWSCKKEVEQDRPKQDVQVVVDHFDLPKDAVTYPMFKGKVKQLKERPNKLLKPKKNGEYPLIYLDFDGYTTPPYQWFTNPTTVANAGMDGDALQEVYELICHYYDPFQVHITTDEKVFNKCSPDRRQRVVFTTDNWYGNAGGVASLGTFGYQYDDIAAFVFTKSLGFVPKFVAVAGAHEAGHTLGLYHQSLFDNMGNKINEYNPGDLRTAPIMGQAYYTSSPSWWKGLNQLYFYVDETQFLVSKFDTWK